MNNKTFEFLQAPFNNFNIEIIENGLLQGDRNWRYLNIISPFNRLYLIYPVADI
jgi:hypothetical protein